jgi:hypothetical protein
LPLGHNSNKRSLPFSPNLSHEPVQKGRLLTLVWATNRCKRVSAHHTADNLFITGSCLKPVLKVLYELMLKPRGFSAASWPLELVLMHPSVRIRSTTGAKASGSSKRKPYFQLVCLSVAWVCPSYMSINRSTSHRSHYWRRQEDIVTPKNVTTAETMAISKCLLFEIGKNTRAMQWEGEKLCCQVR